MICEETRNRIRISLAAYAYEVLNESIISDHEFDMLALKVDLSVKTARPEMDEWFKVNFSPDTGHWVWKHPELSKLVDLYSCLHRRSRWETFVIGVLL